MADPIDLITANPDSDNPTNFATEADKAWVELKTIIPQINTVAKAMNLNSINDISATTNTLGTGSKTFTVSANKSFVKGMILNIVDTVSPSINYLTAMVTGYSGTTLTVDVLQFVGTSGTSVGSWTISMGVTPSTPTVTSEIKTTTIAGLGSTNTAVYRFSTIATNTATADITYTSSATLGDTFKILTAGWYRIKGQAIGSASLPGVGVTVNCTQLSTAIDSLTDPNQLLARLTQSTSSITAICDVTVYLSVDDVIRFHDATGGTLATGDVNCFLRIQKLSLQGVSTTVVEGSGGGGTGIGVNPADYGATGDGSTDDTISIQNAIDAVYAAGGGDVTLEEGTFLVTGLIVKSKVRLIGQGRYATIIKLKNSTNADVIKTLNADTLWNTGSILGEYGWAIEGLQIDGNRLNNTSGSGLKIYGFGFNLIDLLIKNCPEHGIESMWALGSPSTPDRLMEAYVERVTVLENGQNGVYWAGPHDTHFNTLISAQNSQSAANTYHGITVVEGANYIGSSTFTYAHVWGVNHAKGINLESASHIANSHIEGADVNVYFGVNDCTLTGGMIYGVGAADDGAGDIGIEFDNASGCHVNTRIMNCDGGLIKWAGTCDINNVKVSGYNASGSVHIGTPTNTNRLDIQFAGSAADYTFQINRSSGLGPMIKGGSSGIGFCSDNLYVDDNYVGIDNITPSEKLHLLGDGTVRTTIESYAGPATFQGKRGQGSVAFKTNVADTNEVCRLEGRGYYSGTFYQAGAVSFKVDGTPSASSMPGRVVFSSTPSGSNFFTERFALLPNGNLVPLTNNSYQFGDNTRLWSNGYFTALTIGSAGLKWMSGTGSPEGVVTAPVGSLYARTDGSTDTTIYRKESGSDSTGWAPIQSGITTQDVLNMKVVRTDVNGQLIDETGAVISGSPSVADYTALVALDEALYENFVVIPESGVNRSGWISNGTTFTPLNGQYIQESTNLPGNTYIVPNNVTWTASDNGSGKVKLTASGVHGIPESPGEGSYLYLISGGTGWTAGSSHQIDPTNGFISTTELLLTTNYTASMGVPVFAIGSTTDAVAEIKLKDITLPALRDNTEVEVQFAIEYSSSTDSKRGKLYLDVTELNNQNTTAANLHVPYRMGFRNQNDASSQRGLVGFNGNGYAGSTQAPVTAAIATGTAGKVLSIRTMLQTGGMTARLANYNVFIRR